MIDAERIEADTANYIDRLWLNLRRLEEAAGNKESKEQVARAINIFASRSVGLAKKAQKLSFIYQR